jgi:hypothetical protein
MDCGARGTQQLDGQQTPFSETEQGIAEGHKIIAHAIPLTDAPAAALLISTAHHLSDS